MQLPFKDKELKTKKDLQIKMFILFFIMPMCFPYWCSLFLCVDSSYHLLQWSPTFLALGTSFMEDNFSTDWGGVGGWGEWFRVQAVNASNGSGGNVSDAEQQMKLHLLACHSPPAVRPGS